MINVVIRQYGSLLPQYC